MFKRIQWRIATPFILLILVSMGIVGVYLSNFVKNSQLDAIRLQLQEEAKITAEASVAVFNDNGDLDEFAKRLGQQITARITIIAPDGKVLGDSEEAPSIMENHAKRPEVVSALASGFGESIRYSTTLNQQMLYFALPITEQGKLLGIARVALPLTTVENVTNRVATTVSIAMVVTALIAVLAAGVISRATTKPIRELTRVSRRIAGGQFGQQTTVETRDEIGELSSAFNEMSANLNGMVKALTSEKTRLASVLSNMADGVVMTDMEGNVILTNQAAEKVFNFDGQKVFGKSLIEVVHDHEVDTLLKLCVKIGSEQSVQFESAVTKKFLRAIAVPIVDDNPNAVLLLFQDLTELKNIQTMRRELIGNISHELRTPLAGIKAIVETLNDGAVADTEVAKNFLTKIEGDVDRLTQIISELTELSRIETGKAELRVEPANLNQLVEGVIAQLGTLAKRQRVTLSTELSPDLPVINVDKDRIKQTIINLVHNAIQFSRAGGRVLISTVYTENSVIVSVNDNGIGIAKEDLPHVFERFYKVDKARSQGGSGLGLAIAKHTIQAHGGNVLVQSEEGKGSTFSFSLSAKK